MRLPDLSKILLGTALVLYFGHSYWFNTMDFTLYRVRISLPATNVLLKYIHANSFFLFALCAALFIGCVATDAWGLGSRTTNYGFFGASVLLAAGAVGLVMRPHVEDWAKPEAG